MARDFGKGSKEERARDGLSDFQIAVRDAAFFRSPRRLAYLVRANHPTTEADRAMLADFIEKKLKRGRGRPAGKVVRRNDWLEAAALEYDCELAGWKAGGGKTNTTINSETVNFRENLIEQLERMYRPPNDDRSLNDYLDSRRKRRI